MVDFSVTAEEGPRGRNILFIDLHATEIESWFRNVAMSLYSIIDF